MTRCAIYARYSSDRQNERSVADQVSILTEIAGRRGWLVTASYMDAAISGTAMANRPGLLAAIAAAERGEFDVLLVEDEDRVARDEEHQWHIYNRLNAAGVKLSTLGSECVSRMEVAFKSFMAAEYVQVLSAKTKRGVRSNAERGLATGGRTYGYATEPGGQVKIVEGQAQIIRRIFADYAGGDTSREIAAALNAEGIPGPRGGQWNASTIGGERGRGNGVLNTELYIGVKVWGRMDVRKDRNTGKRRPRMLPKDEWKRTAVPHLRIVDDETWGKVRRRKDRATEAGPKAQRRPGLFSGLLKCGVCGGSYTVYTTGKLICATYRERGTCTNRRTPKRADVEAAVLATLREELLSPEAAARYVRRYREEARAKRVDLAARRAPLERRLTEIRRGLERIVDSIVRVGPNPTMETRLRELERERELIEAQLDEAKAEVAPFELHPDAPRIYGEMIASLQDSLNDMAAGETAAERQLADAVRAVIDRIRIIPLSQERGGPIEVEIEGTLARLLNERSGNFGLGARVAGASYLSTQPRVPEMFRRRL